MRRLLTLVALALVAAAGCKETNPDYCPDAGRYNKSCSQYRAALDAKVEAPEAGDAADVAEAGDVADAGDAAEAGDAITDAVEAPAEKKPFCTPDGGECAAMADGGAALVCDTSGAALKCVECVASADCKGSKPVCDTKVNKCVECVGVGTECPALTFPGKPVCDAPNQKCVVCTDNTQCSGKTPICDKTSKECRSCAADSECSGPGICVDWDGHCAQAGEVATLQGGAGCVQASPNFCKASDAVAALTTRSVLVIKGPDAVAAIDPPVGAAAQVLIVGKMNALIGAGSGDPAGVHLSGAGTEFYVRDLKISGGTVGIFVDGAKLAHINRCTITGNGKGGILTSGASFDITNNVIADNLAGLDASVGAGFGGVRLNDPPTGGTARFENNTVVNNKQVGVSCRTPRDVSTSIVYGNVGGEALNCSGSACCGAVDPMLDATNHLTAASPCIDKITATNMSVATDIDRGKRPNGAKLDCGADEFGVQGP